MMKKERNGKKGTAGESPQPGGKALIIAGPGNGKLKSVSLGLEPGYTVYFSESPGNGRLLAGEIKPDIIIAETDLPGMTGLQLCRLLKNDPATLDIPVVLISPEPTREELKEAWESGADEYGGYPADSEIFLLRIANLIENRKRVRSFSEPVLPEERKELLRQNTLSRAVAIIREHIDDSRFDTRNFARQMGMSRTYLFSTIRSLTGRTPYELLLGFRVKKVADKLTEFPGMQISEISDELGFSSPSYMIKCFKKVYGMTPNAYRRKKLWDD